ncbi:hypothetical protein BDV06DRAFT_209289 [Aspergillus oleicola]
MSNLPKQIANEQQWAARATAHDVHLKHIFDLQNCRSASKMTKPQYLALRPLWSFNEAEEFEPEQWGITGMNEARDHLDRIPGWHTYLDVISQTNQMSQLLPVTEPLSNFTDVWYWQQILQQLDENDEFPEEEDVIFTQTPLVQRLRDRIQGRQGISQAEPQTPTRRPLGGLLSSLKNMSIEETPSCALRPPPSLSPPQPRPRREPDSEWRPSEEEEEEEEKKEKPVFPGASDENLVNALLLSFASAVTITTAGMAAHWSFQRKAFKVKAKKGAKIYEARTDGHLYVASKANTNMKSSAIIEVKPFPRSSSNRVRMQETAQVAAWIHAEPDTLDGTPNQRFCRLLLAQNWDAIYLIFAVYNAEYIDYMTNARRDKKCKSFLVMHEYGPFYIHDRKDVEKIAAIISAVTLLFSRGGNLHPPAET